MRRKDQMFLGDNPSTEVSPAGLLSVAAAQAQWGSLAGIAGWQVVHAERYLSLHL